jgi:hypothetical protein
MNSLLDNWQDFCEGKKDFDVCHFYTLFHADPTVLTEDQLKKIFCYFSHSDQLVDRMLSIYDVKFSNSEESALKSSGEVSNDKLISLAVDDLMQKRVICEKLGNVELCNIIDKAKPKYTSDINRVHDLLQADVPMAWLNELVGDYMDSQVPNEKKVYALFEAFYGLTTDYDLVWYAGSPLINGGGICLDYYFNLWKAGGEYVLTHDELLITRFR